MKLTCQLAAEYKEGNKWFDIFPIMSLDFARENHKIKTTLQIVAINDERRAVIVEKVILLQEGLTHYISFLGITYACTGIDGELFSVTLEHNI